MDLLSAILPTPIQELSNAITEKAGIRLYIKRDDLIHSTVSGNKWRKLKYNLLEAQSQGQRRLLTFGGAFSNHLYAVAAAGKALGFETIGIVRGEEIVEKLSPTLMFCKEQGMNLQFVSRAEYKLRNEADYLQKLAAKFSNPFIIPEGGTSAFALQGVAEMLPEINAQLSQIPDYIAVAAGTGGTAAGLLSVGANVLAFSALKGGAFLKEDIKALLNGRHSGDLQLFTEYHFGGYAKYDEELITFMNEFKRKFDIQLEQVYTAKMFFGLFDLIRKNNFQKGQTIVALHTGGLQGLLKS
ncbi:1-aminocyclopropane-1-carboxylate deaminase/D-cysteine desulfhydrase [Dyadobacter psychrophilus]|uniref:1-aminocyclopropane-1-carboxylate deaminase/D-cysteine desulfhydrase, PLP-dependent ACC family n=1 Tax=Dyadobacter psychrophilus TaxID=651661 RepID=A0A1T5FAE4_9BACT|nr:pyridoxal-phosphate dependent enzyme [Dyadobacter psychrophilus]SKB93114.1 1-aminocyclopropane-1-carboxylate deaminase/D-cysteine desulfhydrase, PLP-dependent ACC family [Dyadobacter psychrophilus]